MKAIADARSQNIETAQQPNARIGTRGAMFSTFLSAGALLIFAFLILFGRYFGGDEVPWLCDQLLSVILSFLGLYFGAFVVYISRGPIAAFAGNTVRRTLEDRSAIRRVSGPHCPPPYADHVENYVAGVHGTVTELTIILKTAILNQCHVYHDGRDYFIKRFWYLVACLIFWSRWPDEGVARKLFDDKVRKSLHDHMFTGKIASVLTDLAVILEIVPGGGLDDRARDYIARQMNENARLKMQDASGKSIPVLAPMCFHDFVKRVDKIIPRDLSGICCDGAGCLSPPPGKSALDLLSQIDFVWARRVRGPRVIEDVTLSQDARFTMSDDPNSTLVSQSAEMTRETGEAARAKHERALLIDKALCDLEHISLRLSRSLYGV